MKQYIKPNTQSFSVINNAIMVTSSEPDIPTVVGGFYECGNDGCKPNSYVYNESVNDSRNKAVLKEGGEWYKPSDYVRYQYIGCYQYKSNGSGVLCENFHGVNICEGTQWDLYIDKDGNYLVEGCETPGVH